MDTWTSVKEAMPEVGEDVRVLIASGSTFRESRAECRDFGYGPVLTDHLAFIDGSGEIVAWQRGASPKVEVH